jgi:hypothetical protein
MRLIVLTNQGVSIIIIARFAFSRFPVLVKLMVLDLYSTQRYCCYRGYYKRENKLSIATQRRKLEMFLLFPSQGWDVAYSLSVMDFNI